MNNVKIVTVYRKFRVHPAIYLQSFDFVLWRRGRSAASVPQWSKPASVFRRRRAKLLPPMVRWGRRGARGVCHATCWSTLEVSPRIDLLAHRRAKVTWLTLLAASGFSYPYCLILMSCRRRRAAPRGSFLFQLPTYTLCPESVINRDKGTNQTSECDSSCRTSRENLIANQTRALRWFSTRRVLVLKWRGVIRFGRVGNGISAMKRKYWMGNVTLSWIWEYEGHWQIADEIRVFFAKGVVIRDKCLPGMKFDVYVAGAGGLEFMTLLWRIFVRIVARNLRRFGDKGTFFAGKLFDLRRRFANSWRIICCWLSGYDVTLIPTDFRNCPFPG